MVSEMKLEKRWAIENEIILEQSIKRRLLSIIYGIIFGEAIGKLSQNTTFDTTCFSEVHKKSADSVLDNFINASIFNKSKANNLDAHSLIKRIAPIVVAFGEDKKFEYIKNFLEKYLEKKNLDTCNMLGIIIYVEIIFRLFHYDDYDRSMDETAIACKEYLNDSLYTETLSRYNKIFNKNLNSSIKINTEEDVFPYCLSASIICCRNNDSFEKTLYAISNFSSHAALIGAMTGAMAGIYYQIGKMPENWVNQLGRKNDFHNLVEKFYNFSKKYK